MLFCNIVATSNEQDYATLQRVASGLDKLAEMSPSIMKLQNLFRSFIELCQNLITDNAREHTWTPPNLDVSNIITAQTQESLPPVRSTQDSRTRTDLPGIELSTSQDLPVAPEFTNNGLLGDAITASDPIWELFDAQPTIDWLDADSSLFFDNM